MRREAEPASSIHWSRAVRDECVVRQGPDCSAGRRPARRSEGGGPSGAERGGKEEGEQGVRRGAGSAERTPARSCAREEAGAVESW